MSVRRRLRRRGTPRPSEPGLLARLWQRLGALHPAIKGISAALAFATTVLTFIFLIAPGLRPIDVTTVSAGLNDTRLERRVTLGDYLERIDKMPPDRRPDPTVVAGYTPEQKQAFGSVVSVGVSLEGYKGKRCQLEWSVFDAATTSKVREQWLVDQRATELVPQVQKDSGATSFWFPELTREGCFFVRLFLKHGPETLKIHDTERFGTQCA